MLASISNVRSTSAPAPIAGPYLGSQVPDGAQAIVGPDLGSEVPAGAQAIIGDYLGSKVPAGAQAIIGAYLGSEVPAGAQALLPSTALLSGQTPPWDPRADTRKNVSPSTNPSGCWDDRPAPSPVVCRFPIHFQLPDPTSPIQ